MSSHQHVLILMEWYGLVLSGLGLGPVKGLCEQNKETSGSIKFSKILE
jgi:hypothetical protein